MSMEKYGLPSFLVGRSSKVIYKRWLHRKAVAHRKRDINRGFPPRTNEQYKEAIHQAVLQSNGVDAYTGQDLEWGRLGEWRNEESKENGRAYKKSFGDLPSVDHVGHSEDELDFRICSWRTNDPKNDLTYEEFLELCRSILLFNQAKMRPPDMKCTMGNCPGYHEARRVAHTMHFGGSLLVIDHVPAEVCSVCGDVLLKPDTVRHIEQLLRSATVPAGTVPLYEYA